MIQSVSYTKQFVRQVQWDLIYRKVRAARRHVVTSEMQYHWSLHSDRIKWWYCVVASQIAQRRSALTAAHVFLLLVCRLNRSCVIAISEKVCVIVFTKLRHCHGCLSSCSWIYYLLSRVITVTLKYAFMHESDVKTYAVNRLWKDCTLETSETRAMPLSWLTIRSHIFFPSTTMQDHSTRYNFHAIFLFRPCT